MQLRPYQEEFVDATQAALWEHKRVLSVMATGGGKTITAAELMQRFNTERCLFLADARELVTQCADKFYKYTKTFAAVEMGEHRAHIGERIVVSTTQSMTRRLKKYPRDHFNLIIIDEAHRNTLGSQAQQVLGHFNEASVIGITAIPFRTDKKQLSSFYETISCEIGLERLIKEKFLSRIIVKSLPANIDMRGVKSIAGDYSVDDLGTVIEPHLEACAKMLKEHGEGRRTVVFLPLIETSKKFCDACNSVGLNAVHVDGVDRTALRGDWNVICNASLLTTGWDEPSVSCVMILRPTKSFTLYSQMIGRGTRLFPGKENLLVLDPLYISDKHDLIRPARLFAKTQEETSEIQSILDEGHHQELLDVRERAQVRRDEKLREELKKREQRKARTVDALALGVMLHEDKLNNYEPESMSDSREPTPKQIETLAKFKIDCEDIKCRGHASLIIDTLFRRIDQKLATIGQVKWLIKFNYPEPWTATFEEATRFLNARFGGGGKWYSKK